MLRAVALRALVVDDQALFRNAAREMLERDGIAVVGEAAAAREALHLAERQRPDVTLIDVELGDESGFDLARRFALAADRTGTNVILFSAHRSADVAERVAASPVLGFISKSHLSAASIRAFLEDRTHGPGCRHEALVYSTSEQLVAGAAPFVRNGLASDDDVLVVLGETRRAALREELADDAGSVDFADAVDWYRSPRDAFERYGRYLAERLARGTGRVRIVGDVRVPVPAAEWLRYEAEVSLVHGRAPVSFLCAYDAGELPDEVVADAPRTHPLLRDGEGARPSPRCLEPEVIARFVRGG
jgi:CheY-like chemotaxis protein